MKLGVQLFSSMYMYNEDPAGCLAKLKTAGYDVIEPCVLFGDMPPKFGWPVKDFAKHAALVKGHGQEVYSVHVFARDFSQHAEEMAALAKEFGVKAFVVKFHGPFTEEAVNDFSGKCLAVIDVLEPAGAELWLHNEVMEIRTQVGGVSAYEAVLRRCGGKLGAQVDTGWVACGYADLAAFLDCNAQYVRSIHHKDVVAVAENPQETKNAPIGAGIVDNKAAYDFAAAHSSVQIVDLDNSADDFVEDLAASAAYLHSLEK